MKRAIALFFGRPGGGAFNDAGAAALTDPPAGVAVQAEWHALSDPARRTALVRDLAARHRPDLLLVHGGQGDVPVAAVAPDFPAMRFAVTQGAIRGPNIATYEVLQEHSAWLAGVFAARATRTGIVAHLSGERVRPGLAGRAAFAAGVAATDPAVRLLSGFCGHQHDPALAQDWAEKMFRAGADLMFTMLDGGRSGAIAAARAAGAGLIGNVRDWTLDGPPFVASAVADNGVAVAQALEDLAAGRTPWGFHHWHVGAETPAAVRLAVADGQAPPDPAQVGALAAGRIAIPATWDGAEFAPG